MNEVRRLHAEHQVKDALAMRNDSNTMETLDLPLNSNVRVRREKENWTGPFKLISTNGETCMVQMPYGPANFRSTVVKPYYTEPSSPQSPVRRRRGRLKGSKNKPKQTLHMFSEDGKEDFDDCFIAALTGGTELTITSMTSREEVDRLLALKLRQEQKITTPGTPFELSDKKGIDTLIGNGVFRFERFGPATHGNARIFKSHLVKEIKYEGKAAILTQFPTIQRASQRTILALAPSLMKFSNRKNFSLAPQYHPGLRPITDEFTIYGNMIHWSSTKSKRVTRSILVSEIYGMVGGVDMAFAITSTLKKITDQLGLPAIPIVVCTDSYFLYECIVKLGSTKEKRLMIDIMALRQMYE